MSRLVLSLLLVAAAHVPVHAEIVERTFFSPALGVQKAYRVFLPSGYFETAQRFPVIYLLHGWGVTEAYWSESLGLEAAAQAAKLRALVVMPDGDRSYYANSKVEVNYEACLSGGTQGGNPAEPRSTLCVRRPNYEDYIVRDLVQHIDSEYRTIPSREGRALSGESAGGY
ncbi:alpha/beta hydrolase-fold protein, partial [Streptococcus pyogenes]|uniref:alpha/beta hydrolase-fold protein n=1 Tax=Streptococcus pyogenes TaxID=1314 RepID=UPI003DA028D6